ncbi:MAG: hypothetical protein ACU84Q_09205 [Gammaproteobacteria bacterium]
MNWDAAGAIGEIVGAAGVIATLGYLAVQIRISNTWQKRQGFRDALKALTDSVERIGDNSDIYNKGRHDFLALNEDERVKFHSLIMNKYAAFELFYDFHKSDDVKIEAIDGVSRWMRSDFTNAGVRDWWDNIGRETYSKDFSLEVEKVIKDVTAENTPAAGI